MKKERKPAGYPPAGVEELLDENGDEEGTFDERCKNDGEREDRAGCTRVAAGGFSGFRAEESDAESGADGGHAVLHAAGDYLMAVA